jgi:uncharacterized membrane protein
VATTLRTGRLEAFSDGVFAIAITLLVLEISVPPDASDDLLGAFFDQWPSYLAYLVSFATIGVTWLRHTAITHYLHGVDTIFVRLNLLLLLFVSFLPFPTRLVAEHIREDPAERVAATLLGINLLLVTLVISTMWRYAIAHRLIRPDADDTEVELLTQRVTPSLAGYVVLILVGLALPALAVIGYLAIALVLIVPLGLRKEPDNGNHGDRPTDLDTTP